MPKPIRRLIVIALGASLAAWIVWLGSGSASASQVASNGAPSIRLLRLNPLTVRGLNFRALERVKVTATVTGRRLGRSVGADSAGKFTVRLGRIAISDPCDFSLSIAAVGAQGSRAFFRLPPQECPPANP